MKELAVGLLIATTSIAAYSAVDAARHGSWWWWLAAFALAVTFWALLNWYVAIAVRKAIQS